MDAGICTEQPGAGSDREPVVTSAGTDENHGFCVPGNSLILELPGRQFPARFTNVSVLDEASNRVNAAKRFEGAKSHAVSFVFHQDSCQAVQIERT
jgi:hypothetical protein